MQYRVARTIRLNDPHAVDRRNQIKMEATKGAQCRARVALDQATIGEEVDAITCLSA
jgi:hypothetical protein